MIYKCRLLEPWSAEYKVPAPGSVIAKAMHCSCPADQPEDRELVLFDACCPVHELEVVTKQ